MFQLKHWKSHEASRREKITEENETKEKDNYTQSTVESSSRQMRSICLSVIKNNAMLLKNKG